MTTVLMVLTSHHGPDSSAAGLGGDDVAVPYYRFRDAGLEVVLASLKGGMPPLARSLADQASPLILRLRRDGEARLLLSDTLELAQVFSEDFDAMYVAGGAGALLDVVCSPRVASLAVEFLGSGKPLALAAESQALISRIGNQFDNGAAVDQDGCPPSGELRRRPASQIARHLASGRIVVGSGIVASTGLVRLLTS